MQFSCIRSLFMFLCVILVVMLFSLQFSMAASPTTGGLLQFTDSAEFSNSFYRLIREDFDESSVEAGDFELCTSPLHSSTDQPSCFIPGDIVDGVIFDSLPGNTLAATGAGYLALTSTSVSLSSAQLDSHLVLSFPGEGVHSVGMELFSFIGGTSYQIMVYGHGDILLDTIDTVGTTPSGTFWGIYSHEPIVRLELNNGSFEIIDNLWFQGLQSGAVYYGDKEIFQHENQELILEDFEKSSIGEDDILFIPEPLNTQTDVVGGFNPGEIADGLSIGTVTKPGGNSLVIVGGSSLSIGMPSKHIATFASTYDLEISFLEQVYTVGMDLKVNRDAAAVQLVIYGFDGTLLDSISLILSRTESFLGLSSKEPIGKIEVLGPSTREYVDNIQFGGKPGGLSFYHQESGFMGSIERHSHEDFSDSLVLIAEEQICDGVFDKNTDNSCFTPGTIVHGVSFASLLGQTCPGCIFAYGENFACPEMGKTIGAFAGEDMLRVDFSEPTHYAGFSFYNNGFSALVYGQGGVLLGSSYIPAYTCNGGFWGVKSTEPITSVVFGKKPVRIFLDRVVFGSKFPWGLMMPTFMKN